MTTHTTGLSANHAKNEKGAALLLALMFLAMFALLGAALLTATSVETMVADNYKINTQALYLAEAGVDQIRENLRADTNTATQILTAAGGVDGALSTATDFTTLAASDDVPYANGTTLTDLGGRSQGTFTVYLRNDVQEGPTTLADGNDMLTLISFGRYRNGTRAVEVDLRRGGFPSVPAALTLDGPVGLFDAANSTIFHIDGYDGGTPAQAPQSAIGVISGADDTTVTTEIQGPPNRSANYTGVGATTPNVNNVSGSLDPLQLTPAGLETIVSNIASSATNTFNPGYPGSTAIGNIGSSSNPVVAVVNGDCTFGPGTGYGILLIRGVATFAGNFNWNGLVLIIGQGEFHWNGGGNGNIQGAMFVAKSRGTPRTSPNPVGPMLGTRGPIIADFNGGGGNGIFYNSTQINMANKAFPYMPMSYRIY